MLYINKIDDKNVSFRLDNGDENVKAARYYADQFNGSVTINRIHDNGIVYGPIHFDGITINGNVPVSAAEAVETLNAFLGNFKRGGSSPSPTLQEKTVLIAENGDTIVTPDAGYGGLSKVNINVDVPQGGGGVPVVDPPSGDFYAAIAYFTGENGDYDNIAYAFANNSTEFSAQFCHSAVFANFILHSMADGSDTVVIPNSKMCGFFFGNKFNLITLPVFFLANCSLFNQPITLPEGLTSIGGQFLYTCHSFNQPLTLPKSLKSIGGDFLRSCYSFNQPLILPQGLTSIGDNFLHSCYSFNQPLILPQGLTSIGNYFLAVCRNFDRLTANCAISPTDDNSLSPVSNFAVAYVNGIVVSGAYAQTWITKLPNRTSSPYRNLILAP